MYKAWAAKKGFTILELLITIVVIGILSTIMIVSYNGIQQGARDSERDSNIAQIKIALEKYHAQKSGYPAVCSGGDNSDCAASELSAELGTYIKSIPHDPRNIENSVTDYRYIRGDPTTDSYGLLVNYETKPACKLGQNVDPNWWTPAIPSC